MPAREKRHNATAGLFVLIGLLMLGVLIVEFGRFGDRFNKHYPIFVEFSDTSGIIKGSDVRLRGAKIGKVSTTPELITGLTGSSTVSIELSILDTIKIPHHSEIRIGSSGIMGDTFIQITPPDKESGIYYKSGDTIIGDGAGGFDSIRTDAQSIAKEASHRLREAEATLEKLDLALIEMRDVGKNLNSTIEKINTQLLSPQNIDHFSATLSNFETASKQLEPTMLEAQASIKSIHRAADSTDTLMTSIQSELKHIEPALRNIPEAVQSITRVANKADKTLDTFQNKNSALGTLTSDQDTATNTKEFIRNLKRYGILRYRDDTTLEESDPRNHFRGSRR